MLNAAATAAAALTGLALALSLEPFEAGRFMGGAIWMLIPYACAWHFGRFYARTSLAAFGVLLFLAAETVLYGTVFVGLANRPPGAIRCGTPLMTPLLLGYFVMVPVWAVGLMRGQAPSSRDDDPEDDAPDDAALPRDQ